jgi:hypothetical protein
MNNRLIRYLAISLICWSGLQATNYMGHNCEHCESTIFIPRPQNLNSAALFNPYYYPCCNADLGHWFDLSIGYRYEQTWKGYRIAECLFGNDTLYFAGTQQTNRSANIDYVQAENFGLSPKFLGAITFAPRIQNNIIDFSTRCELDHWIECFENVYVMFNASLVHTNWNLRAKETTLNTSENPDNFILPQCLHGTTQENALHSITEALSGEHYFGELDKGPMPFGRFVLDKAQTKTALANLDMIAGYDIARCDGYHCGLFVKAVAPTGNKPNPETVFSPIVGNAHHWELGGGLDAHYDLYDCDDSCLTIALTGAITHLFSDQQTRTFSIITDEPCCLSQYNLLKEYYTETSDADGKTYYVPAGKLDWGTTFATMDVHSSFDMQGDMAIQLLYRNNGWAAGFGYNVYGRSSETIGQLEEHCDRMNRIYGLKGKTGVCALNGANLCTFNPASGTTTNMQATNSANCVSDSTTAQIHVDQPATSVGCTGWNGQNPVQNTDTPVILDVRKNINFEGTPTQVSHKIFGHIDYQWESYETKPFVGIGGECEFAQKGDCRVCTASQWGIWLKGGLYF